MDSEDDYDGGVVLAGAEALDFSTEAKPTPSTVDKRKRKREREKLNKRKSKKSEDDETAPQVSKDRSKNGAGKGRESKSTATEAPGGEAEPVNEDMARMDPKLLADYVAQRLKRFQKDLSSVELEDRYISGWLALTRIHTHTHAMGFAAELAFLGRICVFGYYVVHLS